MELTRQEAIEKHRALWHEIARRTRVEERKVTKYEIVDDNIFFHCYLCEYANGVKNRLHIFTKGRCWYCPLDNSNDDYCLCGLYKRWCDADDYEKAAEIADQIAELPEVNFNDAELNFKKGE